MPASFENAFLQLYVMKFLKKIEKIPIFDPKINFLIIRTLFWYISMVLFILYLKNVRSGTVRKPDTK